MTPGAFSRMVAPISRRVRSMVARCVLDAVDADTLRQTLKVKLLEGEMAEGVEHFEPYGYTSHPLDGDGVFLSVGGNRSHGVVVNIGGKTYRLKGLKPGEVALYTDEGDRIHFKRGREIEVIGGNKVRVQTKAAVVDCDTATINAATSVDANTPVFNISGVLNVGGNINGAAQIRDAVGTMNGIRTVYNGHTHPENDNGGPTGTPNQPMGGP